MKIINSVGIENDENFEPPYTILWGVNDQSTETKVMTMQRTIIPPGGKNKMHKHTCDATFYVVSGPIYEYAGAPANPEKHIVEAGNF